METWKIVVLGIWLGLMFLNIWMYQKKRRIKKDTKDKNSFFFPVKICKLRFKSSELTKSILVIDILIYTALMLIALFHVELSFLLLGIGLVYHCIKKLILEIIYEGYYYFDASVISRILAMVMGCIVGAGVIIFVSDFFVEDPIFLFESPVFFFGELNSWLKSNKTVLFCLILILIIPVLINVVWLFLNIPYFTSRFILKYSESKLLLIKRWLLSEEVSTINFAIEYQYEEAYDKITGNHHGFRYKRRFCVFHQGENAIGIYEPGLSVEKRAAPLWTGNNYPYIRNSSTFKKVGFLYPVSTQILFAKQLEDFLLKYRKSKPNLR